MTYNEIIFSVFCIENLATTLGMTGDEAYELLVADKNLLDTYIIPNYEILHTQSKDYIVNDLLEVI